jgi:hypothetical protein
LLLKETLLEEREIKTPPGNPPEQGESNLGDEILSMISQRTENPGEAFVLLQQLSIFIWDQYKIDWSENQGVNATGSRKQRYLDYMSQLIDAFERNENSG